MIKRLEMSFFCPSELPVSTENQFPSVRASWILCTVLHFRTYSVETLADFKKTGVVLTVCEVTGDIWLRVSGSVCCDTIFVGVVGDQATGLTVEEQKFDFQQGKKSLSLSWHNDCGPGSSVGIATELPGWTVRESNPGGPRFSARSDRPWDPPSLL